MKRTLLILILFFSILSYAQQITFQGKLFENGTPANGIRTFDFFIGNPINWTESQTVQVNNGLYAVVLGSTAGHALPLNLFATSNSRNLIVKVSSNIIDTVTVYAPFERDYTVPDYIKDGISWSEVSAKPTLDTSSTNELQTLSISNDTLRISQGNAVKLPNGGGLGNQNVVIYGNLTVKDTTSSVSLSQPAYNTTSSVQSTWQSFLSTTNGKLRQIKLFLAVNGNNFVTVKIYNGIGTGSQQIGLIVVSGLSNTLQYQTLDISPIAVSVQSGKTYTFEIAAPIGNTIDVRWINSNPYPYGYCNFGTTADLAFDIFTDNSIPACMTFNDNCYVGIGTDAPTSQLTVSGRIEDQSGFVMPVGFIGPYAGKTVPKGWLLCDGSAVSRITYAELFTAIDTAWGHGDGSSTFNLPDLRGRFLRGVDGAASNDPNNGASANNGLDGKRFALNTGGNTGNNVGSYQLDAFQGHKHLIGHNTGDNSGFSYVGGTYTSYTTNVLYGATAGTTYPMISGLPLNNSDNGDGSSNPYGQPKLSQETRPKNANVNYIIKY
ncbi:MAG: phage tail protein [Chitinophagales bacterium]